MTKKQEEPGSPEPQKSQKCVAQLAEAVLGALGRPNTLRAVHVRWLWGDNYRVNVLTGIDVSSATVAHSYFLTAGDSGEILTASPVIEKRY